MQSSNKLTSDLSNVKDATWSSFITRHCHRAMNVILPIMFHAEMLNSLLKVTLTKIQFHQNVAKEIFEFIFHMLSHCWTPHVGSCYHISRQTTNSFHIPPSLPPISSFTSSRYEKIDFHHNVRSNLF